MEGSTSTVLYMLLFGTAVYSNEALTLLVLFNYDTSSTVERQYDYCVRYSYYCNPRSSGRMTYSGLRMASQGSRASRRQNERHHHAMLGKVSTEKVELIKKKLRRECYEL